ncbi:MAG TPA: kelch repeat-containing protein [Candidatus Binataceae bacterium]|nr:kelch repeat-containing protein [Candidatus Binataceae bacterium]
MQLSGIAIATGAMTGKCVNHAIAQTPLGLVLITGGLDASGNVLNTAELYHPGTGQCVATGNLNTPRYNHETIALSDGRILVIGGQTTGGGYLASAEYFYIVKGVFLPALTGLTSARAGFKAFLTVNGQVLITGGADGGDAALALTELYVPAAAAEMAGVSPF